MAQTTNARSAAGPTSDNPTELGSLEKPKTRKTTREVKEKIRIRKFVRAYLENGCNGSQAVMAAGFGCTTQPSAGVAASRLLKKTSVQEMLATELEVADLTIGSALKPIKRALDAKRMEYHKVTGAETERDDHLVQLKASEFALKLHGINVDGSQATGSGTAILARHIDAIQVLQGVGRALKPRVAPQITVTEMPADDLGPPEPE